jgi:competence ComEA-like helix-hairpin-helix protein
MLRFKIWVKNFFGFPRAQVNGFVILLILVSLFLFSEPAWHWFIQNQSRDFTSDKAKLDSLIALWGATETSPNEEKPPVRASSKLFPFDPNHVSPGDLAALGFSDQLAKRIVRYREKGGRFRIKSDLAKIYGIDSTFYRQLYPFISLAERTERRIAAQKKFPKNEGKEVAKRTEKFDLNKADSSQLKQINGIGDKLSLRILKYRDALGGFINMEQLNEVYGLDSLVINRLAETTIITSGFEPAKLDINTASEKQLADHPYLRKVAKAIVSYRFQHGDFKTVDEIRKVATLDEKTIQKIAPYVKVDNAL